MARDKELKTRRILTAALESISNNGYEGTRLRDVSERAEVSIGVIQHYFGTREQLLGEALSHATRHLVEEFARLEPERLTPWNELRGIIQLVCNIADLRGRGLLWLEMSSLARRYPELHERLNNVYETWETKVHAAVRRGVEDGSFHLADADTIDDLVAVFLAFFDGYEYQIASGLIDAAPELLQRRATLLAARLFCPQGTTSIANTG